MIPVVDAIAGTCVERQIKLNNSVEQNQMQRLPQVPFSATCVLMHTDACGHLSFGKIFHVANVEDKPVEFEPGYFLVFYRDRVVRAKSSGASPFTPLRQA